MNLEKFTDRAKGFLQAAQTLAIRLSHQRITPNTSSRPFWKIRKAWPAG
jgi:hypothetical protein